MTTGNSSALLGGDPPIWVSGTTYPAGKTVRSPINYLDYNRKTAGAGATDPSADTTNYVPSGARAIKSIQRYVITISSGTSATQTIPAVVMANTELRMLGFTSTGSVDNTNAPQIVLTNTTTITASRSGSTGSLSVSVELTEWYA